MKKTNLIQHKLNLDFHYYWHAGTGASSGSHLDMLTEKDTNGLPFISGKHLKGLIRHALQRAEDWGWFDEQKSAHHIQDLTTLILGSQSQQVSRTKTQIGMLQVERAVLSSEQTKWLTQKNWQPHLYREVYSTAIDHEEGSLRGMEVTLPMQLSSLITLSITALDPIVRQEQAQFLALPDPFFWLSEILPLIDSLGGHRTRGFGEVLIQLDPK